MPLVHGQAYSIINTATQTYLDLSGADNATIQGWQNNGGFSNQKWVALMAGDGWTFKNCRTGSFLTLNDYASGASTRVVSGRIPVVWTCTAKSADTYTVALPLRNQQFVLDLFGSGVQDGTSVIIYGPTGNPNQVWQFVTN